MSRRKLTPELTAAIEREAARLVPARLGAGALAGRRPAADKPWAPDSLLPLWGTAAYARLTQAQRLRYNHYYALQLTEEFRWVEARLIIAPLLGLVARPLPSAPLRDLLASFLADERAHVAAFSRLLVTARPDLYRDDSEIFFLPPPSLRLAAAAISRWPRRLSCWVLLTSALESLTISVARRYREAGAAVDPLFASMHLLHAQDEARHCRLDAIMAEWLLGGGSRAAALNGRLFGWLRGAYYSVGWGCDKPIDRLIADFPALKPARAGLIAEAREARSRVYADILSLAEAHRSRGEGATPA